MAELLTRPDPPAVLTPQNHDATRLAAIVPSEIARFYGSFDGSGLDPQAFLRAVNASRPINQVELSRVVDTLTFEYYAVVNFGLAGKKAFSFSNHLTDHLGHTELTVNASLIQLPFTSCLFVFSAPSIIAAAHSALGETGRRKAMAGLLDYSTPISVFLSLLPPRENRPHRELAILAFHARSAQRYYLLAKRELLLRDDWSLEAVLQTDWSRIYAGQETDVDRSAEGEYRAPTDEAFYTDGLAFYRTILNAILYVSSAEADQHAELSPRAAMHARAAAIASGPKRKRAREEARRWSALDYIDVGTSVGPIRVGPDSDKGMTESMGGGSHPKVRFIVRGHWRHQAHGPGRELRRLVWIRPFYKGPEMAALVNKPYLVE